MDYNYIPFIVLTATISVSALLCHFKWALNTKPNSPENVPNWITYIQWHCSGEFPYWPCPMLPRNLSMPLGMIILLGNISTILTDCWSSGETVYMYIYIHTHTYNAEWSQENCQTSHVHGNTECWIPTTLKLLDFAWLVEPLGTWHLEPASARKYYCLSVFVRLTWYSNIMW